MRSRGGGWRTLGIPKSQLSTDEWVPHPSAFFAEGWDGLSAETQLYVTPRNSTYKGGLV
jgi:hypothetical protein